MTEIENPDDYIMIDLQSPDAIVDRLVVLHALVERSLLEAVVEQEGHVPEIEERRFDLMAELMSSHAGAVMAPEEAELLQLPLGQISDDQSVPLLLAPEAFGVIALACGLLPELPIPPMPCAGDGRILENILSFDEETIRQNLIVPSEQEAADRLEVIEVIHWRIDIEFGARLNDDTLTAEELDSIHTVATEAQASGLIATDSNGDLRIGDRPLREWTDDEVETFYIVTLQQRAALEWLCNADHQWVVIAEEED